VQSIAARSWIYISQKKTFEQFRSMSFSIKPAAFMKAEVTDAPSCKIKWLILM